MLIVSTSLARICKWNKADRVSDSWLIIIPRDVDFVPSEEAHERAFELFERLTEGADEVTGGVTQNVHFFDCGENFSRVICPTCDKDLDIEWWKERMDEEYKAEYPLNAMELPCCRARHNLNELLYDWTQGFARYSLEARNPPENLLREQVVEFEKILGCKVKVILSHI